MQTITAIATAKGSAGVAMVKICGDNALSFCGKIFKTKRTIPEYEPNRAYYGSIICGAEVIDDGMMIIYKAPNSYTGEDTVELTCHGSKYITMRIIEYIVQNGARPAEPGEFTKRAFLNGKISLTGAEAVGRLIEAENKNAVRIALAQMKSGLSNKISELYDKLTAIISEVYVYIDYPGEDLSDMSDDDMHGRLDELLRELNKLKTSHSYGKLINNGIKCTILGKPNTGKSTLLNLIAGEDIAIVTDIAGTTRDILHISAELNGYNLKIYDTAGIRESDDVIENIGIKKAYSKADESDLIIALYDISSETDDNDKLITEYIKNSGKPAVALINKYDITDTNPFLTELLKSMENVCISAKTDCVYGTDLSIKDYFGKKIEEYFGTDASLIESGLVLTEERQYLDITGACGHIETAAGALKQGYGKDIVCLDLEQALSALASCDSKRVSEDIVDRIFKNFCVGK